MDGYYLARCCTVFCFELAKGSTNNYSWQKVAVCPERIPVIIFNAARLADPMFDFVKQDTTNFKDINDFLGGRVTRRSGFF